MAVEVAGQDIGCVVLVDKAAKRVLVVVTDGDNGVWDITRDEDAQDLKRRHFVTFAWAVQFLRLVRT